MSAVPLTSKVRTQVETFNRQTATVLQRNREKAALQRIAGEGKAVKVALGRLLAVADEVRPRMGSDPDLDEAVLNGLREALRPQAEPAEARRQRF